jgi:O-acetyl-ADP-ribose deacetylase (regulator of RNase III)
MITSAYNLPSKYSIHVVGPIVSPYLMQEYKNQLAACYWSGAVMMPDGLVTPS